jgi:enoyl-CoA hydratase
VTVDDALVLLTEEPPLAVLEMNRKRQRNALNVGLRDALEDHLIRLEGDDRIKAVVLTGGEDCFSAGFDMKEMLETEFRSLMHRAVEFAERTWFFPKPLVTAIGGHAYAGGFDLAMSGDVIVATEGSKLGRLEGRWINPLLTKLALRIGMPKTVQLSLRAAVLTAEEALPMGVIDRVVPAGSLLEKAKAEALRLTEAALPTIMAVKRAARAVPFMDLHSAIEHEFGILSKLIVEGDTAEALRANAREAGVLKN